MAPEKIKIKVESATAEFNLEVRETEGVDYVLDIVKKSWGDEGRITLHHQSVLMETNKPLSAYNVKDGSVINVRYFVE
ncbi:hypothetical protein CDL12_24956 [Handroanthus impetiginosus]|uniref:Ubiquitin-like domain-containing protein n=1 Tax=Handroanthus impetiginosus TaxID=429701 RepID=A0A2G9GB39_9LAMI|nr:hypothetical protein CDL12_24956 [Handroanthus impetiginosus]